MKTSYDTRLFDPDTCIRAAADSLPRRGTHRWKALDALAQRSYTDFELGELLGLQQTSIGKRRKELVDLGLVEYMGCDRPAPSGSMSMVWCITTEGFKYWNANRGQPE